MAVAVAATLAAWCFAAVVSDDDEYDGDDA